MKTDANKNITNIQYNFLNLPTQVTINGQNITYVYDATGTKLRKTVNGVTTDYAGNFIYENNVLQFFNQPEGYVEPSGSNFNYIYQYKDHLGNIRLSYQDKNNDGVITASTEIVEENNYYPFGLEHKGYNNVVTSTNPAQNYKYNGKELQDELGLNMYDYGARNYDPALGRWMNVDPLSSKYDAYSPFSYAFNSPIYFIDPDGRRIVGASGKDTDKVVKDVYTIFSDAKFESFRNLIKRDKGFLGIGKSKKLAKIDGNKLSAAFEGVELSEDEQALVNTVVNTINSDDIHEVEFADADGNLSEGAVNAFRDDITNLGINIDKTKESLGGVPISVISSQGGSVTKETRNGTFSLIVEGAGSPSDYFNTQTNAPTQRPGGRELSTGHEILGHGRSLAVGRGSTNQHSDAIQMENLIIRVMGHGNVQRNGTDHGPNTKIQNASKIPPFN